MPISGFTPHYDWTSVEHVDHQHRPYDSDVMAEWRGRTVATGALSVSCDMATTTPMFSELATFSGVNESFYAHQQTQWKPCRSDTAYSSFRSSSSSTSSSLELVRIGY